MSRREEGESAELASHGPLDFNVNLPLTSDSFVIYTGFTFTVGMFLFVFVNKFDYSPRGLHVVGVSSRTRGGKRRGASSGG